MNGQRCETRSLYYIRPKHTEGEIRGRKAAQRKHETAKRCIALFRCPNTADREAVPHSVCCRVVCSYSPAAIAVFDQTSPTKKCRSVCANAEEQISHSLYSSRYSRQTAAIVCRITIGAEDPIFFCARTCAIDQGTHSHRFASLNHRLQHRKEPSCRHPPFRLQIWH